MKKNISISEERLLAVLFAGSMIFVGLPNLIFLTGYLKTPYNFLLPVFMIAGIGLMFFRNFLFWRQYGENNQAEIPLKNLVLLFLITFLWSCVSGIGGLGCSFGDPICGDMMLYDLVHSAWPVILKVPEGTVAAQVAGSSDFYLVYYIGFYLPAAIAGKIFNSFSVACWAEVFWSFYGSLLGVSWFCYAVFFRKKASCRTWGAVIFIFFFFKTNSFLFTWLYQNFYPLFYWANSTTLFFNAPQHSLAAWLAGAALWAVWMKKADFCMGSGILAMCILITPFALVGVFLIWLVLVVRNFKELLKFWRLEFGVHGLLFLAPVIPAALYISGSSMSFPMMPVFLNPQFTWPLYLYGLLISLGIPLLLIAAGRKVLLSRDRRFLVIIFCSLYASTCINVGYCNDFPIRASMGPLFLLTVYMARIFCQISWKNPAKFLIVAFAALSLLTQSRVLWKYRRSFGIPPSSGNSSFITFPEKGTILQRMGKHDALFWKFFTNSTKPAGGLQK